MNLKIRSQESIDIGYRKIQVLKVQQKSCINYDRQCQQCFTANPEIPDHQSRNIIDQHAYPKIDKHICSA